MRSLTADERGVATIIEGAVMIPVTTIMLVALLYAAIFACERAILQGNLHAALTYYKNPISDTYVTVRNQATYTNASGEMSMTAAGFEQVKSRCPYRFLGRNINKAGFTDFYQSLSGRLMFNDWEHVSVGNLISQNFIVYRRLEARVSQDVSPAVSLALAKNGESGMTIHCAAKVPVTDNDELIRNVDFVMDIVQELTGFDFTDKLSGQADKLNDAIERIGKGTSDAQESLITMKSVMPGM